MVAVPPPARAPALPPCGALLISAMATTLYGYQDPFVSAENLNGFLDEFTAYTDVDLVSYAGTTHAFSRPDKVPGDEKMRFSPKAAERAWRSIERVLMDAFAVQ